MTCGFCGYTFDPADAQESCEGCPLHRGCHLIRCPRCNYEMPPESKLLGWLKKVVEGRRSNKVELSEAAQEVLELLWTAGEGSETEACCRLTRTLRPARDELLRLGLAADERARRSPSPHAGRPEAAKAVRRHRLAERLVADVLATGVRPDGGARLPAGARPGRGVGREHLHPARPSPLLPPRPADPVRADAASSIARR